MTDNLTAQWINDFSGKYDFYVSVIIMFGGLLSNIFIIVILTCLKHFCRNQCAFYLVIECTANIGLLLTIFSSRILAYTLHIDPVHLYIVWCKLRSWSTQVFGLISLGTISFTAFDQYLSTNYRYSFRQMSTLKLAHRLTMIIICFAIFHHIPLLFLTEIRPTNGCTVYNLALKQYYIYFYYPVFISALPLIITGSFGVLAYRNVRRIIRRQIPLIRRRLDRQLTAMVLARVTCLFVLGLPYIIYSLCTYKISISDTNYLGLAIKQLIEVLVLSLFYANYSINFYIFFKISGRFRRQVKYFIVKKCFHCIRTLKLNSNQVAPEISHRATSSNN